MRKIPAAAAWLLVVAFTLGCGLRTLFGPTATPKPPFIPLPAELTPTPMQVPGGLPAGQVDPFSLPLVGVENAGGLKKVGGASGIEVSAIPRHSQIGWSRDGQFGAALAWDGGAPEILSIMHLANPGQVTRIDIDTAADWVDLSASGTRVVTFLTCPEGHCLGIFDPSSGALAAIYPLSVQMPFGLAVSPDGTKAAVGDLRYAGPEGTDSGSALIQLVDLDTGIPLGLLGEALFSDLGFAPDGSHLAAAGPAGITLWDVNTAGASFLTNPDTFPTFLAFSPDGSFLATDGAEGRAFLWSPEYGELDEVLTDYSGHVTGLSFSADGSVLAVGTSAGEVRLVNQQDSAFLGNLPPSVGVLDLSFTSSGRLLATLSSEGTGLAGLGVWGAKP